MPSRKHFSTSIKPSRTFHLECDVSSINRRRVPYHTRLKFNFDRLLYIIFFITQIHTVCVVSINLEALRVRPSKKKIWNKIFETKIWNKNFEKINLKKKFEKKILEKNFGKINYKTKIFITKIYSNIDKCHTITFSSHTEYVKRESIVIAWVKKKILSFWQCSWIVCLRRQNKPLWQLAPCDN